MGGFYAAVELHRRAGNLGCFVESVCLSTSITDALLRIALILKHQLTTGTAEILEELLYQPDEDKIVSERNVYKRALQAGIIDNPLFQTLNDLYAKRNRVVHRYIISDITTNDILKIAEEYYKVEDLVAAAVRTLENEQMRLRVGMMIGTSDSLDNSISAQYGDVARMIADKHGHDTLARNLRRQNKPGAT